MKSKSTWQALAAVFYSAAYALSVHENPQAGRGRRMYDQSAGVADDAARANPKVALRGIHSKGGQWKFLETAFKNNAGKVAAIIIQEAKRG